MKNENIRNFFDFVKGHNDFYARYYEEINSFNTIDELPILTRDIIRKNNLLTRGFNISELQRDTTNGTTEGTPLEVFKTSEEVITLNLSLWSVRRKLERSSTKRHAYYYYNSSNNEKFSVKENNNSVIIKLPMNKECANEYLNDLYLLKKYNINWLIGPPSIIYPLSILANKHKIDLNVKVVETISEYLPDYYKNAIEKNLNCKVYIQYSCHEVWGMAYSNINGELTVMPNIIIEQTEDKRFRRGLGNCIVTSLQLKSMPFVRYKLTDLILINGNILRTYGFRDMENIILDGKVIHCSYIDNLFFDNGYDIKPLDDYQIIYDAKIVTFYFLDKFKDLALEITKLFERKIKNDFGINIKVEYVCTNHFFIDHLAGKMRGILKAQKTNWEFPYNSILNE